ncbi:MAG: DUF5683 domain-containing protein [Bacteroidetes bacterium]|nr:DUF5683 domain-containing protein [Bacteroidota bacterium]
MKHRIVFFLLLLLSGCSLKAQEPAATKVLLPDSTNLALVDSVEKPHRTGFVRRFFSKDYPNPRKAAFLSLALPGAGQAYNRHWWKLPIVYGAIGGMTWLEIQNVKQYRKLRDNYILLVDGDDNTNPTESPYNQIDATSMKAYRNQWRKYVEQTSLGLGLVYLLVAADAFVDAHLQRFDVSDDLSLRLKPQAETMPMGGPVFGVGIQLALGR